MRYLRIRVDITVNEPIPASFFQNRNEGDSSWVQFKYEHLSDFYYKCEALNHVMGRCNFEESAMITSVNRIVAKLYGLWLSVEHQGNLLFINPKLENVRDVMLFKEKEANLAKIEPSRLNEMLESQLSKADISNPRSKGQRIGKEIEIFHNEVSKSFALETLLFTLKRQGWRSEMAITRIVLDQVKRDNPSSSNIVGWASKVVQRIASLNALARLEVDSECNRLAPIIEGASKDALKKSLIKILSCKRPAQSCLEGSFRSNTIKGPNEA